MASTLKLLLLLPLLWLAACATAPEPSVSGEEPAPSPSYRAWLATMESEAIASGINPVVVHNALDNAVLNPRVVELDRKQPEKTITFASYVGRNLTDGRVSSGHQRLVDNFTALSAASQRYGVPPQVIVALWGMESSFGQNMGSSNVVNSLTTLAYEGRRAAFFRKELINALRVLERENIGPASLKGSWAGAMGQCQFMPSTYLSYAVDADADGRVDIWNDTNDVFASIAHYLSAEGWRSDYGWGQEVNTDSVPSDAEAGLDHPRLAGEWKRLGVRTLDGQALVNGSELSLSLIQPDDSGGRSFLVTDNFRAVMRWNRSTYFATTVGLFSDAIKQ